MRNTAAILKRELVSYFITPVAYVFIVIFLLLTGFLTFAKDTGALYERGQADLAPFFRWHPWLYLFLIPAISMRLWAEERRGGTIELLMTLPLRMRDAVLGKFLAAWAFVGIGLVLTFPVWITVNYLGDPDNGVILAGYLGSFLMAGAYLAVGSAMSAFTRNQVIAFVLSVSTLLVFLLAGYGSVLEFFSGWAPLWLTDAVASFGFLTHFEAIMRGVIDLRDLVFFLAMMAFWLFVTALAVDWRKAR
ncbi:MAG: ABC transporter permease [Planctomycetota bacterium]|nr:MAG: ABC transporter permease [Planctomycetota bacterium]